MYGFNQLERQDAAAFAIQVKQAAQHVRELTLVRVTTRNYYEQAVAEAIADIVSDMESAIDLDAIASRRLPPRITSTGSSGEWWERLRSDSVGD